MLVLIIGIAALAESKNARCPLVNSYQWLD
jgi:hypothetical protein